MICSVAWEKITYNVSGIYVVVELELLLPIYLPKPISEQKDENKYVCHHYINTMLAAVREDIEDICQPIT